MFVFRQSAIRIIASFRRDRHRPESAPPMRPISRANLSTLVAYVIERFIVGRKSVSTMITWGAGPLVEHNMEHHM